MIFEDGSLKKFIFFSMIRGLTLIEILLVMVLFGVIAGITLPNFNKSFAKLKLKSTADDLAYCMRYAQSRAIFKNQDVCLVFDDQLKGYWLLAGPSWVDDLAEDVETKEFQRISGRWGRKFQIPQEFMVESAQSSFTFYPNGQIEKARIRICSQDQCMIVSSQEQRGKVSVFDETLE